MSSSFCTLKIDWVQVGDHVERVLLLLVEELLTVGVSPRETTSVEMAPHHSKCVRTQGPPFQQKAL